MNDDILNPAAPPSLPREHAEPAASLSGAGDKRVRRRDILKLLNYINFHEGTISASFRHIERGDRVYFRAFPRPCLDEVLDCLWVPPGISLDRLELYECEGFMVSDGQNQVTVKAEVKRLDSEGITFRIPESGNEKISRKVERHLCESIDAKVIQAGLSFEGRLVDFNALSIRVELEAPPGGSLRWINSVVPVSAMISKGGTLLFSGECAVARTDKGFDRRCLVLSPNFDSVRRYKPRKFRSQRYVLSPAPAAHFSHPFTGKRIHLQVEDISGTGLRVEESFDRSVLLPGMVIPEIVVEIANQFVLKCRAQVLYRHASGKGGEENAVGCGIVFLDMDIEDQARLSAFLHQSADGKLRVCGVVDMEELWRFFFDTGFIYPSKYLSIEARKEEFKRTYEKLYLGSPSIARHFIIEDKGRILGHMSMIRYYSNSWILHHHAALHDAHGMAGVEVLDQAGRYTNDFHLHPSAHMDYLMCYYRKENRFPSRVFGSVARDIADPKGSSLDSFAYFHLPNEKKDGEASFQLFPARADDFAELRRFYERASGGLALDALNLTSAGAADAELDKEYARQGFRKERYVFSLRHEGRLAAVMALTLSDLGLNLSSLTNCVHLFVLDGERLSPKTLFSGLRAMLSQFGAEEVPILAYPASYLDRNAVPCEKEYTIWVLDTDRSDGYFGSLNNTFRRTCGDADDGQRSDG
jgi:hypothetical protein